MNLPRIGLVFSLLAVVAHGQDWPQWRGPEYDGSSKASNLPAKFDRQQNVRWTADMPGRGAGTPIVVGKHIFLTSIDSKRNKLVVLCVDRDTGKTHWKRDGGTDYTSDLSLHDRSNYASPSPATDGKHVVFFFGNGDLCCFDLDGQELWRRNLQKDYGNFAFQWTFSSSPTIWEGKVFLPILQRDTPVGRRSGPKDPNNPIESFLLALDPKTGKTLYKHNRPSDAIVESRESYGTLIPRIGKGGRKELLCTGGDVITGHDPATGKELWRWGTWNEGHRERWWRLVPTPVVGDGVALVCAPKRAPVYAVKLDGSGTLDESALAWKSKGRPNPLSSDVPTPAYEGGHFFVLSDVRHALSKVNARTGEVRWSTELSRDYAWRSSPTVADGKVYCMNHNGQVVVLDARKGTVLHTAQMGNEDDDHIRASIVVADGSLFIRTNDALFRVSATK
ncbi:MAG: PQQ-binding-like beta-propeller repeat protein [Planctomycetes bacterium]|jgi:outer membrane protein assembly factor BamB|nr:PQQ-binding-like beta-propeller repeat protein [Planctomycetota bacterium]